ncbi:neprilysin-1-like [Drosophila takahashii]|uniref:neprilysin-1-like n=1 Tax=Drosophila takahashii TaxID=29030 RepID=UPI00389946BF
MDGHYLYNSEKFDFTSYFKIAWNLDEEERSSDSDFKKMDEVCGRHPEAVANYLAMQLLYAFDANLQDIKYQKDYCAATMRSSMWPLFKKLFLAENFSEKERTEVSEIVQEVRSSWRMLLERMDFLNKETRREALGRESILETNIHPNEYTLLTDRLVQEILNVEVVDGNFAVTSMNLMRLKVDIQRFSTRHSLDQSSGIRTQEGAFQLNSKLTIFAGGLHPPAYHRSLPDSLKYGTLGYIIGQLLTSSLVDSDDFEMLYSLHKECLAKPFSKHLKPKYVRLFYLFIGHGGLRQAFEAYRSHRKQLLEDPERNVTSEEMPGLDLSPEQLFFLGFAQMYCPSDPNWAQQKHLVLSALSNSQDFHQAFNCPVGSRMRPSKFNCYIWY